MNDLNKKRPYAQEESITSLFFKDIPSIFPQNEDEKISELESPYLKLFSTVMSGSFYVLDFHKRCFHFVSEQDLFLSGYSFDDALKMGYDFFSKIVHPDDLQLFIDIHCAILHYLSNPGDNPQEIDYFAFNIRFLHRGLSLMVYHKMIPFFLNGCARMAVCHLSDSVIHKSGNLEIYSENNKKYSSYSFAKCQWQEKKIIELTNREKEILKLARQGKSNKEIADILHITEKTIRNFETILYPKLNVHSVYEAIIYATNHRMIFT
ncbi:hypothetical protein FACS189426_10790 [Bacteroidia bacterium]|nr:hypothetical protein FACS189426_10790 [Bacteroidia bacterium]GHT85122.1 hypothetical protein FACS18947_3490 [Bacteroidia bacterium]